MALTDEGGGSNMVMPVGPMGYGGNNGFGGFGGDLGSWIILFLIFGMFGGWGGNSWNNGGMNNQLSYDFPWLMNGQNRTDATVAAGFQNAATQNALTGIQASVTSGFGDVQNALCGGFAGVNASINGAQNAISQQMYSNQIADMERSFNAQTMAMQNANALQAQLAQCCCDNRASTADLKYTVATENCADRTQSMQNTRDIIDAINARTQGLHDKLCQLEMDGYKAQLAQAQRDNVGLQNQLNMATLRESQTAQNALITQGFANEVDALYNRLNSCPVSTVPVYGKQPIFTCQNGGCGYGM